MALETVPSETPPVETIKSKTLQHFYTNMTGQVLKFWLETSPYAYAHARWLTSSVSEQEIEYELEQVLNQHPFISQIKPEILTLAGGIFEALGHSYLKVKEKDWHLHFEPLTSHFNNLVTFLSKTERVKVVAQSKGLIFKGTSLQWEKANIVIPDGLVVETDPEQQTTTIAGIYECSLHNRAKSVEKIWLFIELLRTNPELFNELKRIMFPGQNISLNDDHEFQFVLVTREDFSPEDVKKALKKGWTVVVKTPFSVPDVFKITLDLLRNHY